MFLTVNGGALFVVEEGRGFPVVFVHGFPLSHKMWEPQMKALKKSYRVIAYDVRGHGQSDIGDGHYTLKDHVDDLAAMLDKLKIPQAVIVGLSMGGYIAQSFVEHYPKRVRALVLMDTKSEADSNEGKLKRFQAIKDIRANGLAPFAETSILSLFSEKTLNDHQNIVDRVLSMIMDSNPHAVIGTLLCLASRFDTTDFLKKVTIPTLLLGGEHDVITPLKGMQSMAELIPNSVFHAVPDAGHMSNLENANFVNHCLLDFLAPIEAAAAPKPAGVGTSEESLF